MERELPIMADLRRLADSLSEKDETMRAAADVIGAMDGDLSEQKAAHRDCIKRNIALAAENSSLRSELDEARKENHRLSDAATIGEKMWTPDELSEAIAEARKGAFEEAAQVAESATLLIHHDWAPGPVRTPIDHRTVIASAIRQKGESET